MQIELNQDAIDALAMSQDVQDVIEQVAQDLADSIRSLTPEMSTPQTEQSDAADPGEMIASIEVGDSDVVGGRRVLSTDGRYRWIEFGTGMRENASGANRGEMPAFAPFRRSAEAAPGRYEPTG